MHAVMVVFSDKVFTSVQKLHRLSFTSSKMQHNCLVYFLEIVFPYGRGKASLDVYPKELSVHSRMSDLICHRRETHAHSLKKVSRFAGWARTFSGRCQISRRISSIWSIIPSLQSGLDRNPFSAALAPMRRKISPSPSYAIRESDCVFKGRVASSSHSDFPLSFVTFVQNLRKDEGGKIFPFHYRPHIQFCRINVSRPSSWIQVITISG